MGEVLRTVLRRCSPSASRYGVAVARRCNVRFALRLARIQHAVSVTTPLYRDPTLIEYYSVSTACFVSSLACQKEEKRILPPPPQQADQWARRRPWAAAPITIYGVVVNLGLDCGIDSLLQCGDVITKHCPTKFPFPELLVNVWDHAWRGVLDAEHSDLPPAAAQAASAACQVVGCDSVLVCRRARDVCPAERNF